MESLSDAENVEGKLGVIQGQRGQIFTDNRIEIFECVGDAMSGRRHQRSNGLNPYSLSYGRETWWVESSSDAENVEGRLGVIQGQIRSNPYR